MINVDIDFLYKIGEIGCLTGSVITNDKIFEIVNQALNLVSDDDDDDIRFCRAVARTLRGDLSGAIEDLEVTLSNNYFLGEDEQKIREYLASLQADQNPFTPEILKKWWDY